MSHEKLLRSKKCLKCYNHNVPKSSKCKFCGNRFKTSGKWSLVEKFKQVLRIDRGFAMLKGQTPKDGGRFFTKPEIETLLVFDNLTIIMFLTLDDINMLDENALLELGHMLTNISKV